MRIPTTTSIASTTINITLQTVPTSLKINIEMLSNLPRRLNTSTEVHRIQVMSHCTADTTTNEWDYIPYTVLVVTTKKITQVEHDMLVQNPISVEVALCVSLRVINLLTPNTLKFCTQTDTWSEPLTDSQGCAWVRTELFERTSLESLSMLLSGIPSIPICTSLDKPIAPERICCNTILLGRCCVLSETAQRDTSKR